MLSLAVLPLSELNCLSTVGYLVRPNSRSWPRFCRLQDVIMIAVPGNRDAGLPDKEHRLRSLLRASPHPGGAGGLGVDTDYRYSSGRVGQKRRPSGTTRPWPLPLRTDRRQPPTS